MLVDDNGTSHLPVPWVGQPGGREAVLISVAAGCGSRLPGPSAAPMTGLVWRSCSCTSTARWELEESMNLAPLKRTALRWIPTAGAGLVPQTAPSIFHGVPWVIAFLVSAAGVLLGAVVTIMRVLVPEVLSHFRVMRQLSNDHVRAILREGNQHDEVVQLLDKINGTATFHIDLADAVKGIRSKQPDEPTDPSALTAMSPSAGTRRIRKSRKTGEGKPGHSHRQIVQAGGHGVEEDRNSRERFK